MKGIIPYAMSPADGVPDSTLRAMIQAMQDNIRALYGHGRPEHAALLMGTASQLGMIGFDGGTPFAKAVKERAAGVAQTAKHARSDVGTTQWVSGIYDATGGNPAASYNISGLLLPDNAYVVNAWFDVLTAFAGVGAFVALDVPTDDPSGILAPTAIAGLTVGAHAGIPNGTAATFTTKTTASRIVQATISGAALTAGKLKLFIEYAVSE